MSTAEVVFQTMQDWKREYLDSELALVSQALDKVVTTLAGIERRLYELEGKVSYHCQDLDHFHHREEAT